MLKKIIKKIHRYYLNQDIKKEKKYQELKNKIFFNNGQIPWSEGYYEHKRESITKFINSFSNS